MIQRNNIVMRGSHGMLGDQIVFRMVKGVAILAAPPEIVEGRIPDADQLKIQNNFKLAARYAKAAIKDPATKAAYLAKVEGLQSPYTVAVADYLKAPEISELEKVNYLGVIGNTIRLQAVDDFMVTAVKVSIHTSSGILVEQGDAIIEADELHWVYTTTVNNPEAIGSTISVSAFDLPGNETILEAIV